MTQLAVDIQEPHLIPWLTVQKNLELVLHPYGATLDDEALESLLRSVGLGGCAVMFPDQLSGDMKRHVALLRAFTLSNPACC